MSEHDYAPPADKDVARSLLDRLLQESLLYRTSADYLELLAFVGRLRGFAPFNAMLLQIQKPGLRFAASATDWMKRFGRYPREGARPLLIMWPFGPVALVYDVVDTEGAPLPEDINSFVAYGSISSQRLQEFGDLLAKRRIECFWIDEGDQKAGMIRVVSRAESEADFTRYRIHVNRNHLPQVQLVTLAHELGHLCLGHLGKDPKLGIPARPRRPHAERELEAESVAYIVCERLGIESRSKTYLSNFVKANASVDDLDLYQIMRAAGQVEQLLGLLSSSAIASDPRSTTLPSTYGHANSIFTRSMYERSRARLFEGLEGQGERFDGFSPEWIWDGIVMAGFHAEAGAAGYVANQRAMVADLGVWSMPAHRSWYRCMAAIPHSKTLLGIDRGLPES